MEKLLSDYITEPRIYNNTEMVKMFNYDVNLYSGRNDKLTEQEIKNKKSMIECLSKINGDLQVKALNELPIEVVVKYADILGVRAYPTIGTSIETDLYKEYDNIMQTIPILKEGKNTKYYNRLSDLILDLNHNESSLVLMIYVLSKGVSCYSLDIDLYNQLYTRYTKIVKQRLLSGPETIPYVPNSEKVRDIIQNITNNRLPTMTRVELNKSLEREGIYIGYETLKKVSDTIVGQLLEPYTYMDEYPLKHIEEDGNEESIRFLLRIINNVLDSQKEGYSISSSTVDILTKEYIQYELQTREEDEFSVMFPCFMNDEQNELKIDFIKMDISPKEVRVLYDKMKLGNTNYTTTSVTGVIRRAYYETLLLQRKGVHYSEYQPTYFESRDCYIHWVNVISVIVLVMSEEEVTTTHEYRKDEQVEMFMSKITSKYIKSEKECNQGDKSMKLEKNLLQTVNMFLTGLETNYDLKDKIQGLYVSQKSNLIIDEEGMDEVIKTISDEFYTIKSYMVGSDLDEDINTTRYMSNLTNENYQYTLRHDINVYSFVYFAESILLLRDDFSEDFIQEYDGVLTEILESIDYEGLNSLIDNTLLFYNARLDCTTNISEETYDKVAQTDYSEKDL